jgi:hypothetical protein
MGTCLAGGIKPLGEAKDIMFASYQDEEVERACPVRKATQPHATTDTITRRQLGDAARRGRTHGTVVLHGSVAFSGLAVHGTVPLAAAPTNNSQSCTIVG